MAQQFRNIISKKMSLNEIKEIAVESINWWRNYQKAILKRVDPAMKEYQKNKTNTPEIGKLYFFLYDAKTKEDLPYWDAFPLVFPIKMYKNGFLGINLHYLDYQMRSQLMAALFTLIDNPNLTEDSKLKISYSILNRAKKYKFFRPCIKRYLVGHFRSGFYRIPPEEWTYAMLMPREQFQKTSKYNVWEDSKSKV